MTDIRFINSVEQTLVKVERTIAVQEGCKVPTFCGPAFGLSAEQAWERMREACEHGDCEVGSDTIVCCYEGMGHAPTCTFASCPLLKEAKP